MGRKLIYANNPLVSTKHRRKTLAMIKDITDELQRRYGSDWNRDDTILYLALHAGFSHRVPDTPTSEKLNHVR